MKISGLIHGSTVDGPGYNFVIFMQGCSHKCKGCHNPETWDICKGEDIDLEDLYHLIINDIYTGVTLSGGDPMYIVLKMPVKEFQSFLTMIRDLRSYGLSIICYTGYYYEELIEERQKQLLQLVDVLIDGPFEIDKKKELPFRGSENQNVYALTDKGYRLLHQKGSDK